ncbi:MAG: translation initiation factor IF-2 N-terminal domain-containing protein, partial [Actinomycetota bacterium]|nr:translation initiation factor IF-2 N-terminal domain-containing protein [Actinomycetota bacterium]
MAKKRVHEIAKERGMPSKDVIAVLQQAGLDVKAAASSVDDADVSRAFDGGPLGGAQAEHTEASAGNGAGQSPGDPKQSAAASGQVTRATPAPDGESQGAVDGQSRPSQESQNRPRPTRGGRGGEQAPGGAGRRRRVVIDSQASR